jgi:ATP-binding cassette subfamily D (ALD) long-chain fatty acid import protein
MTNLHTFSPIQSTPLAAQGWQLTTLASSTDEEKMEIDLEIERLGGILGKDVHEWQKRLDEVNEELSGRKTEVTA